MLVFFFPYTRGWVATFSRTPTDPPMLWDYESGVPVQIPPTGTKEDKSPGVGAAGCRPAPPPSSRAHGRRRRCRLPSSPAAAARSARSHALAP
uniref:Uncharacterized protein n=1 Tax=Oryza sativa subsp. japonica TaxID=39947 RepID=Q6Z5E5_ORYSJ|nr:hypothetical protein [Oryza sativa Japonica Group]